MQTMPRYALPYCRPSRPFTNPHFHQLFQVLRIRSTGQNVHRSLFDDGYGLQYETDFILHPGDGSRELVIVIHGLAANTGVAHVQGMMGSMYRAGYDVAGLNLPGCTPGTQNTDERYHFGYTRSLEHFAEWAEEQERWEQIHLVGFSLGGSIVLNYLINSRLPSSTGYSIAVSAPLDLNEFYSRIHEKQNRIYERSFITALAWQEMKYGNRKVFPAFGISSLREYDRIYTLPSTPYSTMEEYIQCVSPGTKLEKIKHPFLLLNARDDTFLGPASYPSPTELDTDHLYTAYPEMGAHCGFKDKFFSDRHFSEEIAVDFIKAPVYQQD